MNLPGRQTEGLLAFPDLDHSGRESIYLLNELAFENGDTAQRPVLNPIGQMAYPDSFPKVEAGPMTGKLEKA